MSPAAIASTEPKKSKLESLKERSNFLREPVATELKEDTTHFSKDGTQIIKYHGFYQQSNRDIKRVPGQEKDYSMMLRTRNPGGFIPPELYLAMDGMSDDMGCGNMRITTRQGLQLHGILKKDIKTVISTIVRNMGSTLGACGDLNRNVMAPPAPYKNRLDYQLAWKYADNIADLLTPQTGAYYEIWLDGEKAVSAEEDPEVKAARQRNGNGTLKHGSEEPLYGTYYMPRKFKIAVTVPGDNSIDILTQDIGLVVICDKDGKHLGFNVYAGGGMGRTHNKEETFARAADPIGFVAKEDIYDLVKAILSTQRDYGDRENRRHARMKYLLHDWGVEQFTAKLEAYFGKKIQPMKPQPAFKYLDFLGWHEQGDGKLFLGVNILNGRVKDEGEFKLKTALRKIVEQFHLPIRLTGNHNAILYEIDPKDKDAIQGILDSHGIAKETDIDPLERYVMACPALPTCGLAMTESERMIPNLMKRLRTTLTKVGLKDEHFVIRMTGCPNGCARPYMGEVGFVGSGNEMYQLWLGGCPNQTRLARPYMQKLQDEDIEAELEPMFVQFKRDRKRQESFGDFCDRVGFDALRSFSEEYKANPDAFKTAKKGASRKRWRVELSPTLHDRLKEKADAEGKSLRDLAAAALEAYLQEGSEG